MNRNDLIRVLTKITAGDVIDFKPYLRKHKGRPQDFLDEPTSIEVEDALGDISDAIEKSPEEAVELAVDLIFKVTEGGANERYISNYLAVLKGFPFQQFKKELKL